MNIFYTPDLQNNTYILNEEESKHCLKVLRLNIGDTICLVDGIGGFCYAKIVETLHKRCFVEIFEKKQNYEKRNYYIHLAVAPTKNIERFEWFLEKATEIGIDEITPIICQNSERKIIKPERLEKIILAAMKQSQKAYKPKLNSAISFNQFTTENSSNNNYIAHCWHNEKKLLKDVISAHSSSTILIGPEGDFSKEEVALAISKGWQAISLGNSRLRTETAAVVACHSVAFINL